MRSLVWMLGIAACGGGSGGGGGEVVENLGQMCLHALDPNIPSFSSHQSFVAGQPVFVRVDQGVCLSSSCTDDVVALCELAPVASGFGVTAELSWIDTTPPNGACTADCRDTAAICQTVALAAGTFEFAYAGQTFSLAIPSEFDEPPCVGTGF